MPVGTPTLERLKAAVSAEFPDAIYGQFVCKRRNGWNWSQHAGSEPDKGYKGNAVDIVHKDHGYGDKTPAHKAWLDRVNAFLIVHADELDINELIWRKIRHHDHIHTSCWPKLHDAGLYKPPCRGGNLIVVNKDGSRGDTFDVLAPPPPPPSMENANMAYADTLSTPEWAALMRDQDIDRIYDLGIIGPGGPNSDPGGRNFWKNLDSNDSQWEGFRRSVSAVVGFWQPN
jgi:hypothetical protein